MVGGSLYIITRVRVCVGVIIYGVVLVGVLGRDLTMDTQIDVDRWVCAAEAEICEIDGALNALGAEPTPEGIDLHGLANLDAPGVAAYLRGLAAKLQVVATNLNYLADHADLTELAASLNLPPSTLAEATPGSSAGTSPGLVSQEVERLLAQLEEPVPPVSQGEAYGGA